MAGRARFAVGQERMGFRAVYLIDEAGDLIHTEPVCSFPEKWHPWFFAWLEAQAPTLPEHVHGMADKETGTATAIRRWGLAGNVTLPPSDRKVCGVKYDDGADGIGPAGLAVCRHVHPCPFHPGGEPGKEWRA